jgi:ubiquinone biosynthesis monooxygenase Coq7
VVLRHLEDQANALASTDAAAVSVIRAIILDEQTHHDRSAAHLPPGGIWQQILDPIVSASTEAVIWLGMKL